MLDIVFVFNINVNLKSKKKNFIKIEYWLVWGYLIG